MFAFLNLCSSSLSLVGAWSDFYYDKTKPTAALTKENEKIVIESGNSYVLNCLFDTFTFSEKGGCIYQNSADPKCCILIESCTFTKCTSNSNSKGTVIWFGNKGNFVMSKICGYEITATSGDLYFCETCVSNGINNLNIIHMSSIHKCTAKDGQYLSAPLFFSQGMITGFSFNETKNQCLNYPTFYFDSKQDADLSMFITYSSFTNNTAFGAVTIEIHGKGGNIMRYCNVIGNKQNTQGGYGIFCVYGHTSIEDTCILKNVGKSVVYVYQHDQGAVYSVELKNCTIDFEPTTITGSYTVTQTPQSKFINRLFCITTHLCKAKDDYVKDVAVIDPLLSSLHSCYSFKRYHSFKAPSALALILLGSNK